MNEVISTGTMIYQNIWINFQEMGICAVIMNLPKNSRHYLLKYVSKIYALNFEIVAITQDVSHSDSVLSSD